jgi:DNA-binding MarR family transcriptional regulator
MGQGDIIEVLEKHNKPISRRQIAEELDWEVVKVSHLIKRMLANGSVKCIELDRFQSGKMLGMNRPFRRIRLYYL